MPRIVTYSLRAGAADSDGYYQAVAALADAWVSTALQQAADLVSGFRQYRQAHGQPDRSDEEYVLELLAQGVHLREHGEEAASLPGWSKRLLSGLSAARSRWPKMDSLTKPLIGAAEWITRFARKRGKTGDPIADMIAWLEANGEESKAGRFAAWLEYFRAENIQDGAARCRLLADDFNHSSLEALGEYTENIDHFVTRVAPKYRWRYDIRLLSHTRLEYHFGMLATEIQNRAYRKRFLSAGHKIVIVPPCMCAPAEKCKAVSTPFGEKCQSCTPSCRVNQVTKLGEKYGFGVFMIPDDVKVFGSGKAPGSVGVVGISCALTNWSGGWDAESAGIPAQGLLLDYVGCSYHWDREGFPTDTNLYQLQATLGIPKSESHSQQ